MTVLNQPFAAEALTQSATTPAEIALELANQLAQLRAAYYDTDSAGFDYRGLAARYPRALAFSGMLTRLRPQDFDTDPPQARTAFWLNVYGLLAIHAVVADKIPASVLDKHHFFSANQYQIGNYIFSLDDIEHGLLRGNARKYLGFSHPFSADDPRLALALAKPDPRIHFALYAACRSSPLWRIYFPDQLDGQLDTATRDTLRRDLRAGAGGASLTLPKVFQWYEADFGTTLDVVRFVHRHLADLPSLRLGREHPERVEVAYLDFDWSLNER